MKPTSAGAAAPPAVPDWDAIRSLQERAISARTAFEQDRCEHAIDSLLLNPDRRATGQQLVQNVRGSSGKIIRAEYDRYSAIEEERHCLDSQLWPCEAADFSERCGQAAARIVDAIDQLPVRQRDSLLAIPAMPESVRDEAIIRLSVGKRQRRNLASQSRRDLVECAGVIDAANDLFRVASQDLGFARPFVMDVLRKLGLPDVCHAA